jgi:hypothetical protein
LVRSPLYHEMRVPEFAFKAVDGPTCWPSTVRSAPGARRRASA